MISKVLAVEDLGNIYAPGAALGGTNATIGKPVSPLINNLVILAAIGTFFFLIFAGFNYITAGGDKNKLESANNSISYAVIGLVLVVSAYLITTLAGKVGGLDNIFNPN